MRHDRIKEAEFEARRFLARVAEAREALDDVERNVSICGSKETGALRRASLDLTRALAAMRRPS